MLKSALVLLFGLVSTPIISVHSQEIAPTNLKARQSGVNQVSVTWILPRSALRSRTGYRISTTSDTRFGVAASSNADIRPVLQQPGEVKYWLSSLSTPSIVIGPAIGIVRDLSVPLYVTFTSINTTSVTVSWTTPPHSLPIDEYRVQLRLIPGFCQVRDDKSKNAIGNTMNFDNLMEFSNYSLELTLILFQYEHTFPLSNTKEDFTTLGAAPTAPPRKINLPMITSRMFNISWTEIECTERNSPITMYRVDIQKIGGTPIFGGFVVDRFFFAGGLIPDTNYDFKVSGVNRIGTGPSKTVTIRTSEGAPGPVSNLIATPKFTSIVLTWRPPRQPNGVIISYQVTYTINDNIVRVNTSALSTTFTIPSLTPQTRVSAITVYAYTKIGRGEPANLPLQTTFEAPTKVMGVQIEYVSDSSVRVSWGCVVNTVITGYIVYYSIEGQTDKFINVPNTINTVVIEDLTESNLRNYKFQVVAITERNGEVLMGERSAERSLMSMFITWKSTLIGIGAYVGGALVIGPIIFCISFGCWLKRKKWY